MKAIDYFFRVHIASSKNSEGWENSQKLSKPSTKPRGCKLSQILRTSLVFYFTQVYVNKEKCCIALRQNSQKYARTLNIKFYLYLAVLRYQ